MPSGLTPESKPTLDFRRYTKVSRCPSHRDYGWQMVPRLVILNDGRLFVCVIPKPAFVRHYSSVVCCYAWDRRCVWRKESFCGFEGLDQWESLELGVVRRVKVMFFFRHAQRDTCFALRNIIPPREKNGVIFVLGHKKQSFFQTTEWCLENPLVLPQTDLLHWKQFAEKLSATFTGFPSEKEIDIWFAKSLIYSAAFPKMFLKMLFLVFKCVICNTNKYLLIENITFFVRNKKRSSLSDMNGPACLHMYIKYHN